jgi:ATP-dependent DNA helicase PIF1
MSVPVILNADQRAALEAVQRRENIFLTGPAGSGKSTLIAAIVEWAKFAGLPCHVAAMTGCAALLLSDMCKGLKAKTLHSWAGIGLGRGSADILTVEVLKSPYAKRRWKTTSILIIDEISMMQADLFEKLNTVGQRVRGNTKPWGGIQLILCGDFFQLPPVQKDTVASAAKFAFDSPAWSFCNLTPVVLERIERQTDAAFQKLLNEARVGRLSEESVAIIRSRQGIDWKTNRIRPTLLFSRNADVDTINNANITALARPIRVFEAETVIDATVPDEVIPDKELLTRLVSRMDSDSSYVPELELCEGCQVMLVFNKDMERGLVNGSRGVVVAFRTDDGLPIVQFLHGDPVVIERHEWVSNECAAVKRRQIPLRVAYALTIHKSQGATLDCALVDIGSSTFECGQAYVALSRVRSLESLYVWNFKQERIMADPRVIEFYEGVKRASAGAKVVPATPPSSPALGGTPDSPIGNETAPIDLHVGIEEPSATTSDPAPVLVPSKPPRKKKESKPTKESKAKKAKKTKKEPVLQLVDEVEEEQMLEAARIPELPTSTSSSSPSTNDWSQADPSWHPILESWKAEGGAAVLEAVEAERATKIIFPPHDQVFAALSVPLNQIRVVLVGQDPYHGAGQAMGLAFSVPRGIKLPPSLKNIRKEFLADGGSAEAWPELTGDLTPWVRRGVLLLNTTLTVEEGKANSHASLGWDGLTQRILEAVVAHNECIVFLAWGKYAQGLCRKLRLGPGHHVLDAAHPSPLSAQQGFFGSRPFSKTNSLLPTPIDWSLH